MEERLKLVSLGHFLPPPHKSVRKYLATNVAS